MQPSSFYKLKINNHNPFIFNIILWSISFLVLLFTFSDDIPAKIDYIYTGSFLVTIIIPVLINLYILIPFFLTKEKYLLFVLFFIVNLVFFSQMNIWFFSSFIDYIFPDYYFISYHSNTKMLTIFGIFLITTTLIKLSEDWFYFNKRENNELKLKNISVQNQLLSLRSQINPHFLFNSLNVIYALALDKKEETTEAIVQLSDILRYVIYDSNTERVKLKDEINLIQNYINFQRFRQQPKKLVKFEYNIEDEKYQIYPMLLLPLVENSFKHGINSDNDGGYIFINLELDENILHFSIENNFSEDSLTDDKELSGLGIENIKKNLEIVYPNKHTFTTTIDKDVFKVSLKLFENES